MEIIFGIPKGSILDPLLFKIFLVDFFFIVNSMDIENYADDNMRSTTTKDIDSLIVSLSEPQSLS